jgi:lysophospholipase L1-like esterase
MKTIKVMAILVLVAMAGVSRAGLPWQFAQHTRYMAMGDSLAAGYGAIPATNGYAYLLYHGGAFDTVPNTLLSNVGVPGATSQDVLDHQVPLAVGAFEPQAVTLTVGGNDLLAILNDPSNPAGVIMDFATNLSHILWMLCDGLDGASIYVSNLYTVPLPGMEELVAMVVSTFNTYVENAVASAASGECDARLVDVYSAFKGRNGLLLIERNQSKALEVHPTNAGYRVMAQAFTRAIEAE